MSKYKKDELAAKQQLNKDGSESEYEQNQVDFSDQQSYQAETINQLLEIDIGQNKKMLEEKENIKVIKIKIQALINNLLECKKGISKESMNIDKCVMNMKSQLTSEQTAKFLILMEKFKSKEEFSVFNLWKIKSVSKQDVADGLQRTISRKQNDEVPECQVDKEGSADGVSVNQI